MKHFERRGQKRGALGWHCYFDIANNCIYDGILQSVYFALVVPIKRWHFPSVCSLLVFYVLLSSRVCVLLSKRANFSQWCRGGEAGSVFYPSMVIFLLVLRKAECGSFSVKRNATHRHAFLIARVFQSSYHQPMPGLCMYLFNLPSWQVDMAGALINAMGGRRHRGS